MQQLLNSRWARACTQAAMWDMRRQGLSLRQLQYGFTTSAWCTPMATAFAETCFKYAPGHKTQLRDGDVAKVASASCPSAGVQNVVKRKIGGVGGARSAMRRPINPHEVHAVYFPFVTQVMWATRAPQLHRVKVLLMIAIDGT